MESKIVALTSVSIEEGKELFEFLIDSMKKSY